MADVSPCLQVSTGVTLRENNLKEIEGGKILESQGVLVANRRALKRDAGLMKVVHELIERFEVGSLILYYFWKSAGAPQSTCTNMQECSFLGDGSGARVRLCALMAAAVDLQAHLKADKFYSVIANMRGTSTQEVASKICNHSSVLRGLQVRMKCCNCLQVDQDLHLLIWRINLDSAHFLVCMKPNRYYALFQIVSCRRRSRNAVRLS